MIALLGPRQKRCPDQQCQQQHKQQGDAPAAQALDPGAHPSGHDKAGEGHAHQVAQDRITARADRAKKGLGGLHVLRQAHQQGMKQGAAGPAHQHRVVAEDADGGHHKQPAQRRPAAAPGRDRGHQGGVTRAAAQDHLGDQHRQTHQQHDRHVQHHKRQPAPLGGAVGKAPEIPQTDSAAGRRQHKPQGRAPVFWGLALLQVGANHAADRRHQRPVSPGRRRPSSPGIEAL